MALILLGLSAVASLLFIPFAHALSTATGPNAAGAAIGLIFLSVIRVAILIAGLFSAAGFGQGLLLMGAAIVMEIVSCGLHIGAAGSGDNLPYFIGFEAAATLLPAVLIAAGVLTVTGHRLAPTLAIAGALLPLAFGAVGLVAANAEEAAKRVRYEALEREAEARAVQQRAALDAVPADADVSVLLAFTGREYEPAVQTAASERIVKTPGARAQLESLPGDTAKELVRRILQNERLAELAVIPHGAGLDPLLPFAAPGEDPFVITAAQERIRGRQDAENELRAALLSARKLAALGVLASYDVYGINDETVHLAFKASGVAAREIDARMASANPPSKAEIEAICSVVGLFAGRFGKIADGHADDVRATFELGQRAERELKIYTSYAQLRPAGL